MELIDKAAVVARLEEKLKSLQKEYNELVREEYWIDARNVALRIDEIRRIISLISNFGGKEADLVKESEDYKQKYEEALKRAEECHIDGLALSTRKEVIEHIFPELKESKDEKMWKLIKKYAHHNISDTVLKADHITREQLESWLEKQGKQEQLYIRFGEIPTDEISKIYRGEIEVGTENGVSVYPAFKIDEGDIVLGLSLPITKTTLYTQQQLIEYGDRPCYLVRGDYVGKDTDGQPLINNISIIEKIDGYRVKEEKQDKQNPTEEVVPRFKFGDWVIPEDSSHESVYQVEKMNNEYYTLKPALGASMTLLVANQDYIRPWTIQDAEEGDILCYKDEIFVLKFFVTFSTVVYHCCYDDKNFILNSVYSLSKEEFNKIHPATKEQRNLLFQKIREAGYEWNSDKKELIRHGQ